MARHLDLQYIYEEEEEEVGGHKELSAVEAISPQALAVLSKDLQEELRMVATILDIKQAHDLLSRIADEKTPKDRTPIKTPKDRTPIKKTEKDRTPIIFAGSSDGCPDLFPPTKTPA